MDLKNVEETKNIIEQLMEELALSDANPYKIQQLQEILEEIGKNPVGCYG